jgi:hypothetical protein
MLTVAFEPPGTLPVVTAGFEPLSDRLPARPEPLPRLVAGFANFVRPEPLPVAFKPRPPPLPVVRLFGFFFDDVTPPDVGALRFEAELPADGVTFSTTSFDFASDSAAPPDLRSLRRTSADVLRRFSSSSMAFWRASSSFLL